MASGHYDGPSSYPTEHHGPVGYHGPIAKPVVLKDGFLADTHEVAAARSAHLAAVAKSSHGGAGYGDGGYTGGHSDGGYADGGHGHGGYAYHGPLAAPVLLKSGYLADTHDVAAAKGAHLVALEKAHSHGGYHY